MRQVASPRPDPAPVTTTTLSFGSMLVRVATQDRDAGDGLFDALKPAAVLRDCDACVLHLARPGFAAKLRHELVDLAEAGGADRMSLGFEPARRVDRNASTDARVAALRKLAAFAIGAKG